MNYDLEERTSKFGENIIKFCKILKRDEIGNQLIRQIVRSATSISANYMEANQASSRKDFRNKIRICQKEVNKTKHWLRMIVVVTSAKKETYRLLWKEAHELTLIFAKNIKDRKR